MGGVQTLSWKGHSHIGGACVGMLALKTQMKVQNLDLLHSITRRRKKEAISIKVKSPEN